MRGDVALFCNKKLISVYLKYEKTYDDILFEWRICKIICILNLNLIINYTWRYVIVMSIHDLYYSKQTITDGLSFTNDI